MNTQPSKPVDADTEASKRLPCRGCKHSCKLYRICDGKPWRLPADALQKNSPV